MKILLFGEFSGFFNCLKDGLVALGHEVFLASNGDIFKDYPSDFRWDAHIATKLGPFGPIFNFGNIMLHRDKLKGFDVVLLIEPNNISRFRTLNAPVYEYLLKHNNKVFLSGSGDNASMFDYWYNSNTKYHEYYKGYLIDSNGNGMYCNNPKMAEWERYLIEKVDGYIPIWYEYAEPYRHYKNCKRTVRIPVNISNFEYKPNLLHDGKIVFYHGITRACKGTRFIQPAFEKMKKSYGDKAEFICAAKLPFDEYMKVVEKTNVIVDDANSFSIAMNGLFSLAKGKLIMGGAEPIANAEYGYAYNPVFNINPDVDQICSVIEDIISRKEEIEAIGQTGRKFVEEYHNHIDVAKEYVKIFEEELNK